MTTYILILAPSAKLGYAGIGGVAMQEFESQQTCEAAGQAWVRDGNQLSRQYLCVEK